MLISIAQAGPNATDLGYLLHKNPANLHSVDLSFGVARVFCSDTANDRCRAHLLLEIDPVELVRGAQQLEQYVNDRPYVASSYMTVALGRVFGMETEACCEAFDVH